MLEKCDRAEIFAWPSSLSILFKLCAVSIRVSMEKSWLGSSFVCWVSSWA